MDIKPSVEDNYLKIDTMDFKSGNTLSVVMWALGFVETKAPIEKDDYIDPPADMEDIEKLYATPGNYPDNVAIHYEPSGDNTYFRLSVKDADGVYQPLASVVVVRSTCCEKCALTSHINVYLLCRRTNRMFHHTIQFDEGEIYSGEPYMITEVRHDENPCSLENNFYNYMFRKDESCNQIIPDEPVEVAWLP